MPADSPPHVDERIAGLDHASRHVAHQEGMVVQLEQGAAPAAQIRECALDAGDSLVPLPCDARELVVAETGEYRRELALSGGEDVDAELIALRERRMAARGVSHRHERRRRTRAEGGHRRGHEPAWVPVR